MSRLSDGTFRVGGLPSLAPTSPRSDGDSIYEGRHDASAGATVPGAYLSKLDDLKGLSADALLESVLESEFVLRQFAARQAEAIALLAARTAPARRGPRRGPRARVARPADGADVSDGSADPDASDDDLDPDEDDATQIGSRTMVANRLAPELTITPQRMSHIVATTVHLTKNLPGVMALVKAGRLDWLRAELIARRLHNPSPGLEWFKPGCDEWAIVQAALVLQAPALAYPQLKELIGQLLQGLRPTDTNERHRQANDARRVWTEPLPDGMAAFGANLSAEKIQLIEAVLDAMADAARDAALATGRPDPRTHEQRRADALAAIFQALAEGIDVPLARDPRQFTREDPDPRPAPQPGHRPSEPEADNPDPVDPVDPVGTPDSPAEGTEHSDSPDPSVCSACARRALIDRLESETQAQEEADQRFFTEFGLQAVPTGHIPAFWELSKVSQRNGRATLAVVTLTDRTLRGLSETLGHLQGYGAIAADQARRIAAQATSVVLMPVFPDHRDVSRRSPAQSPAPQPWAESGSEPGAECGAAPRTGSDQGHEHDSAQANRYRPGNDLARQVIARYQTCTYPNCPRPAATCDLDHLTPFERGGRTCACNLHAACRRHHRAKTFGGWEARMVRPDEPYPPGTIIWTTPDGVNHDNPPPCLPGMPGWTVLSAPASASAPEAEPASKPTPAAPSPADTAPNRPSREDAMPAAERTTQRTKRWQQRLDRQFKTDQAQLKARERNQKLPPVNRPPNAPWGESTGIDETLGPPPF
ncbi:HNH endonuclease signature motif containing protein [Kineosporia babensis]|uniref:HNH endonuclease n=1 Tax=Kineosporia babensis TaxID=499548 RepID=A0A9X1N9V3_9ACTN|nr:HNH endonuclease [Kineosporia babensis]